MDDEPVVVGRSDVESHDVPRIHVVHDPPDVRHVLHFLPVELETDRAAETRLPMAVINSLRDKLVVIRAAPDERTLRYRKSLHYEKLSGRGDKRSIRINKQWRMVFTIETGSRPNRITVSSVEDYH